MTGAVHEPARDVSVADEVDVLVVGGGVTGVSAAAAAAREGACTAIVERQGFFGGTAAAGLVTIWTSLCDTTGRREIIGGLTREVLDRLRTRRAAACRRLASRIGER